MLLPPHTYSKNASNPLKQFQISMKYFIQISFHIENKFFNKRSLKQHERSFYLSSFHHQHFEFSELNLFSEIAESFNKIIIVDEKLYLQLA
jgi:hypothetical protein